MTPVYGPDGTEYPSYEAAIAAGVVNPMYIKPATAPQATSAARANIPTYGGELAKLMSQYGVQSPVAPRTTDQALLDQYFGKVSGSMYDQPQGNALFNQYLSMGMGQLPALQGPMTSFFGGQPVCPEGHRYDPVTTKCVDVTDPGGVASAGRITTGTPNIGGNQCPPGFTFDPATRSCIPGPDTGLLTGGQSISGQQPMPTCPPGYVLDPINRSCVPASMAGNIPGNQVQQPVTQQPVMQQPITRQPIAPPPIVQQPIIEPPVNSCPPGYELNNSGNCVPTLDLLGQNIKQSYDPGGFAGTSIGKDEALRIFETAKGLGLNVPQLTEQINMSAPHLKLTAGQVEDAIRWAAPDEAEAYLANQTGPAYDPTRRYAKGGAVDLDGMVKKYQVGGLNRIPGFNQMVMGQQEDQYSPPLFIDPDLREMMSRYDMRPEELGRPGVTVGINQGVSAPDIGMPASQSGSSSARQQYEQAAGRLRETIQSLSAEPAAKGPSKAEMYFRLAAAFGRPTATGNFFENLGLAGQELAAYKGEQRATESSAAEKRRNLALELGKFDVEQARELMQMEREASKPLSEYGRVATDEGFAPGSLEHQARVQELQQQALDREELRYQTQVAREERIGDAAARAASRMTAGEMRMMSDAEKEITAGDIAISTLNQAIDLSEDAYTASIADQAARAWAERTDPQAPKVVATRVMEQLVKLNVLNNLKLMFGGNPTEGERAIAFATAGLEAISITERNKNLKLALDMATMRMDALQDKVSALKSGEYAEYAQGDENGE
jgi:hypothetical protein